MSQKESLRVGGGFLEHQDAFRVGCGDGGIDDVHALEEIGVAGGDHEVAALGSGDVVEGAEAFDVPG